VLRRLTAGDPLKLPRTLLGGLLGAVAALFYTLRFYYPALLSTTGHATYPPAQMHEARIITVVAVPVGIVIGLVLGWRTPRRRARWCPPPQPGD
jgi:hypothetical protein